MTRHIPRFGPESTIVINSKESLDLPRTSRWSRMSQTIMVVSLAVWLLTGCAQGEPPTQRPPPPTVTVAKPLVQEITEWDAYTGRLQAVESVEVRARVSGYLQSVHFEDGHMVKRGELLFVIDPRPYRAVVDEASATLSRARVRLTLAESNLDRSQRLFEQRAVSEEELDQRAQAQEAAVAGLQAAEAALQRAELNLKFTTVEAPISGRVSREFVTRGNLISGGSAGATLLTTIVSLDPIYLYFTADEQALLRYTRLARSGQRESSRTKANPVRMQLADEEGYPHRGHMSFVDNQVDEATGTIEGRATFENPNFLFTPGIFARILLRGRGPYEALLIPDAAVSADQATRFVYVVGKDNIVKRRDVVLGRWVDDRLRVVEQGLKPSDRIITEGLLLVQADAPVTPEMRTIKEPGTNLMATAQ